MASRRRPAGSRREPKLLAGSFFTKHTTPFRANIYFPLSLLFYTAVSTRSKLSRSPHRLAVAGRLPFAAAPAAAFFLPAASAASASGTGSGWWERMTNQTIESKHRNSRSKMQKSSAQARKHGRIKPTHRHSARKIQMNPGGNHQTHDSGFVDN